MPSTPIRSLLLASAVVGGAALLGACGSASSSSTSTSTSAPVTSSTTAAGPSSTSSATSTHCRSENLIATLGPAESGAGQRYNALILTNIGTTACELRGFPGVSLLDSSGTQIGSAATREGPAGPTVPIPPGGRASAALHTSTTGMGATCTASSTRIRVFPPDNTVPIDATASYSACGTFSVSTLVSGDGGR